MASTIAGDLEAVLISIAVKQAASELILAAPFFAWPVINPVTVFILTKLITLLVQKTAIGLSLLWINLSISYEVSSQESATAALKAMLLNPEKYNADQQAALEANFDASSISLIRLGISSL